MDFNSLMAKMRELDQPAIQSQAPIETAPVEECGDMMGGMPPAPSEPPKTPPSMSINVNAQGLDDIAELMQLLTKVNPDMMPKSPEPMPSLSMPPAISAGPSLPPLKMLPAELDLDDDPGHPEPDADNMGGPSDNDADNMPGGMDGVSKAQGDLDNDGDHDMDDHDMEKDDKKKDEWANEPDEDVKDVDYMVNRLAGGMNKPKQMVKHSYRQGDNPMAMPESKEELRASIRAELQQRLAEARGAK